MSRPCTPPAIRFWAKVDKSTDCWRWTAKLNAGGYGGFRPDPKRPSIGAHIWAYVDAYGPVPDGMVLDHICHDPRVCHLGAKCPHRSCVNPAHLRPVLPEVNTSGERQSTAWALGTHCQRGHEYDNANTYRYQATGKRYCRACRREYMRQYKTAKQAASNTRELFAAN